MKLGAIDVGSNAMRVLIADVTRNSGNWHIAKIGYMRLPIRLGEDVFEKGKISEEKIKMFIDGMKIFQAYLNYYNVQDYRAVATSAMRDSSNAHKIQQQIKKETRIKLEVISGIEEAELVYSTFQLIADLRMNYVLVDVGGGSTEITLFQNNKVHAACSFQIGGVRLLKNKVNLDEWGRMIDWIKMEIIPMQPARVFGAGGTINSVHKMLMKNEGQTVSLKEIQHLQDQLELLSLEERIIQYKIKPDRADVMVPAMEIYMKIIQSLGLEEIYVPKMGLADGILLDLYREKAQ